jgi:hypothetical protein
MVNENNLDIDSVYERLHIFVSINSIEPLRQYINGANNINPNYQSNVLFHIPNYTAGDTLLHTAIKFKKFDIINMLIHEFHPIRVNINLKNILGETPIFLAAKHGHYKIIKNLYHKYSRLYTGDIINETDNNGYTPLLVAYKNNFYITAIWILENCIDVNYTHISNDNYSINTSWARHLIRRGIQRRQQLYQTRYVRSRRQYIPNLRVSPINSSVPIENTNIENTNIENTNEIEIQLLSPPRINRIINYEYYYEHFLNNSDPDPLFHSVNINEDILPTHLPSIQEEKRSETRVLIHAENRLIDILINEKKECPICYQEYQRDKTTLTKCGHDLCISCYDQLVGKCHMCREVNF